MTKRIISVLLVLVMSMSLFVPSFAVTDSNPVMLEDKSLSDPAYSVYGKVFDYDTGKVVKFDYTVPENGASVIIFYSVGDSAGMTLIGSLSASAWASSKLINIIAIECSAASKDKVDAFLKTYDANSVIDKNYYNPERIYLNTWYMNYVKNNGNTDNITADSYYPCYAFIATASGSKKYIRFGEDGFSNASDISSKLAKVMDTSSIAGEGSGHNYSGFIDSGFLENGKLPKAEILRILEENPKPVPTNPYHIFSVEPGIKSPYSTGKVKDEYLVAATNRLSALRRIAGLGAVTMDASLNENAQYGAVLLAASNFSHTPEQPSDMDDDFFKTATAATSSSNIYAGCDLTQTPDGFMKDYGMNNTPRLGHRRWQLSPYLGKVGFGFALNYGNSNGMRKYAVEKVFDTSAVPKDYMFIGWPASGNFPRQLFDGSTAWSVTVSPNYYSRPEPGKISVELTRESDGKKWTFLNAESYDDPSADKYFAVNTEGYGSVSNCIIFRPDGIEKYDGVYTVVISGLEDGIGNPVTLSYKVDFFGANDTDVTKTGWVKENGYWYYFDSGLEMAVGWQKISGKWYYFNSSGQMQKGWQKIGKSWYYFESSGAMLTGWQKISKKWYYFNSSGAMLTGWQKISKKWYYFNSSGAMLTGWQKISKKWYYFNSSGDMKTGWLKSGGKWYYFNSSGVMLANCSQKIGSKTYKFDKSGVCLNP